jgi:hypothetical protein
MRRHDLVGLLATATAMLICFLMAGAAGATQRCVLAELFTTTLWIECGNAEAALDSVVKYDFDASQLAVIRSHRGGFLGTAEGIQRFLDYYPPTYHPVEDSIDHWTPTLWVAGLDDHTGAVSNRDSLRAAYNASISSRLAADSPLAMTLEVEYGASGDSGTVSVEVVATDVITFTGLHLRLALI